MHLGAEGIMDLHAKGYWHCWFFLFVIWICSFWDRMALAAPNPPTHVTYNLIPTDPPNNTFEPIEISPAMLPPLPYTIDPMPPMYPSFPRTYDPVLTGKCPVNFSIISSILDRTASDCSQPLASLVGNVICCPQIYSLLHIFQGNYSMDSGSLVLTDDTATDCFSDIMSILASRGSSTTIPSLCSVQSFNLTGGSCPVKDIATFEKTVNTSKLLDACSAVDPLRECCRPFCQPAINAAALRLVSNESSVPSNAGMLGGPSDMDVVNDCKGVVHAWLSRKLPVDTANTAFRILLSCKVNKICPLEFKDQTSVIKACSNRTSPSPACCSSLNAYIASLQKQMLITNKQALNCATFFGSQLQKGGVLANLYELCNVDLKDFSLQAFGLQGCLLRSLPADVIFDNSGFSLTCDLSDNIAAPWPSSSLISSLSLCAPEMSLPALPTLEASGELGRWRSNIGLIVAILLLLAIFV